MTSSSLTISEVVAGEAHTLALTDSGQIFTWGRGFFGRLGTGQDADEAVPILVPCSTSVNHDTIVPQVAVAVAAGAYHSLALVGAYDSISCSFETFGDIIVLPDLISIPLAKQTMERFGLGVTISLGHEQEPNSIPHLVSFFDGHKPEYGLSVTQVCTNGSSEKDNKVSEKPGKVVDVEAGGMMSCAVDENGCLWMWGHCPLPLNTQNSDKFILSSIQRPQLVRGFHDMRVSKVACGNEHVIALIDRGNFKAAEGLLACYSWGSNNYGQLGLGDKVARFYPEHAKALDCQLVGTLSQIACGAFHSVVITHQVEQSARIESEQAEGETHYQALEAVYNSKLSKRSSACWTFGMGGNGQLGHGTSEDLTLPKLVQGLPEQAKFTGVSCGLFHTGILTEMGDVWVWGMEKGLGLCPGIGPPGTGLGDALYPLQIIENGGPIDIDSGCKKLACGAAHTVVVASKGSKLWSWGRGQSGVLGTGDMADSVLPCQVVWPPPCIVDKKHFGNENDIPRDDLVASKTDTQYAKGGDHPERLSEVGEMEKKLAAAEDDICSLKLELSAAKSYAANLHSAIYGIQERGDGKQDMIALQDWERKINESSYADLVHLEAFYHKMRSRVKDLILQRRINDQCSQFMKALQGERKLNSDDSIRLTR